MLHFDNVTADSTLKLCFDNADNVEQADRRVEVLVYLSLRLIAAL